MANISDLRFDDKNFNAHTEYGMSLLEKSLRENGAGRSILIDKDNNIIAGNGIIEAAGNIGLEDLQIVETDGTKIVAVKRTDIALDSKEGREMALADNATAAEDLSWDRGNIEEVSEKFGIDPGDWISDWDKDEDAEVEEDEAPEADESEPPKPELGRVYQLGNHRLMCGDSTDAGTVAILMDGQNADLWMTDPPYNVEIVGGSHAESPEERKKKGGLTIQNDKMSSEEFADFLSRGYAVASSVMKPGAAFYIWHCDSEGIAFRKPLSDNGLKLSELLIWNKSHLVMGRLDYQPKHEPCLYGWKEGESHNWYGDRKQTTVIDWERPSVNKEHPTMKPVGLIGYLIQNSTKKGESVLDTFGGSGTTLIACEQLGRKCYMMELDPRYCDVIRKRYWKLTHDGNEEGWEEGTPAIINEQKGE